MPLSTFSATSARCRSRPGSSGKLALVVCREAVKRLRILTHHKLCLERYRLTKLRSFSNDDNGISTSYPMPLTSITACVGSASVSFPFKKVIMPAP
ncbi:MAG: hypothetical protein CM1200mP29_11450 [Verrucomicrobiota bacterium]|nr:MAG: hypothetical protein CM1200mP29_11450 [Verrucomicrobiota bacterium]